MFVLKACGPGVPSRPHPSARALLARRGALFEKSDGLSVAVLAYPPDCTLLGWVEHRPHRPTPADAVTV
jgi:hypothetical protein